VQTLKRAEALHGATAEERGPWIPDNIDDAGKSYVTDLDAQTLKRAEALHRAMAEERGPWIPDNINDADGEEFMV